MTVAYPLISNILGRIAVLPASSLSTMFYYERIKSANTNTLK